MNTTIYIAPHDNHMPPRPSRDCVAIRHFYWIPDLARLVWMFHELLSRDREDGRATWQPQGVGSEAYLNGTPQEPTPEDAREATISVVAAGDS
jgi:hypothetical protein